MNQHKSRKIALNQVSLSLFKKKMSNVLFLHNLIYQEGMVVPLREFNEMTLNYYKTTPFKFLKIKNKYPKEEIKFTH